MSPVQKPQSKRSGGKQQSPASLPSAENKSASSLTNLPAEFGVVRAGKSIVVHDQTGQIVSVTRVSPDSPYGVGVKAGPGQVVKEYEAEDLQDAVKPDDVQAVKHEPAKKRNRG
jgi:hypothetical protein